MSKQAPSESIRIPKSAMVFVRAFATRHDLTIADAISVLVMRGAHK